MIDWIVSRVLIIILGTAFIFGEKSLRRPSAYGAQFDAYDVGYRLVGNRLW